MNILKPVFSIEYHHNFQLKSEFRSHPEYKFDNIELKAIVQVDESQSTAKLAADFNHKSKQYWPICNKVKFDKAW